MVLSLDRWVRQVAVVTGASTGCGAAIATELVRRGLKVVGLSRKKDLVEELSWKLSNEKGKLYAVECDITIEKDIHIAFKWIEKHIGPVSILINNAGVCISGSLCDGDIEIWRTVFETNVMGLCIATKEAIKQMKEHKIDGHIIHINSIVDHQIPHLKPLLNVYPASKYAVSALAETLRMEFNNNNSKIKITNISPGHVNTEMFQNLMAANDQIPEMYRNPVTLNPEDVGDAVVYALSTPPHVNVSEIIVQAVGETFNLV